MSPTPRMSALLPAVEAAAALAVGYYRDETRLARRRKADRSLVTAADRAVEALLRERVAELYPDANLIGEEEGAAYDPDREWTFAIDPIDGTDSFAAGAPGWGICLGLLDGRMRPVGGIVHAPKWESVYVAEADPDAPATLNGSTLPRIDGFDVTHPVLMIDSKFHRGFQLDGFAGKARCYGSTALHMCLVAEQAGAQLAHIWSAAIWDIVAAHAIVERVGAEVRDTEGRALDYRALVDGRKTASPLFVGHPDAIAALQPCIRPRRP